MQLLRHTLRGCVDWNLHITIGNLWSRVTPFVGVWIETIFIGGDDKTLRSHPSWVCGLKHTSIIHSIKTLRHTLRGCVDWNSCECCKETDASSHTLRGCVDWNCRAVAERKAEICHTLRGCVDWNLIELLHHLPLNVTPFVGVWIETDKGFYLAFSGGVTPFVGVWIETDICLSMQAKDYVTPFVGVWIETIYERKRKNGGIVTPFVGVWIETLTMPLKKVPPGVTPFVGVWIETCMLPSVTFVVVCHTLRGCVDWNIDIEKSTISRRSHTLRGCVDWNTWNIVKVYKKSCHTLRGCVDWNRAFSASYCFCLVTPFVGVWIETVLPRAQYGDESVTPFVGVWIETWAATRHCMHEWVTPFVGVWIETPTWAVNIWRCDSHTLRGCVDWNC